MRKLLASFSEEDPEEQQQLLADWLTPEVLEGARRIQRDRATCGKLNPDDKLAAPCTRPTGHPGNCRNFEEELDSLLDLL